MNMMHSYHTDQIKRLDAMEIDLCMALYHLFGIMSLVEGPRELSEHEYWIEADEFWHSMRDEKCTSIRLKDGRRYCCPNDVLEDKYRCEECRDRSGGQT